MPADIRKNETPVFIPCGDSFEKMDEICGGEVDRENRPAAAQADAQREEDAHI